MWKAWLALVKGLAQVVYGVMVLYSWPNAFCVLFVVYHPLSHYIVSGLQSPFVPLAYFCEHLILGLLMSDFLSYLVGNFNSC